MNGAHKLASFLLKYECGIYWLGVALEAAYLAFCRASHTHPSWILSVSFAVTTPLVVYRLVAVPHGKHRK